MFEIFSRYMRLAKTVTKTDDLETLLATAKNIERGTLRLSSIEENGFAAFLERTTINHYEYGIIPLVLYDFQRELANTIQNNRVVLVEHARQMGITSIISRYAAHTGLSLPGQNIAVVGHSFGWSSEIARNLCEAISHMDVIEKTTRDSIRLRNGTVIHVVSAPKLTQAIRQDDNLLTGMRFGFDTVIFDNANYISFSKVDDITRLLLRSNVSKIIAASTSTHKDGAMMQSLCNGFPEATIVNLPWSLHPHRDEQWMEKTKNILGEDAFALEYECRLKR